MLLFDAHLDLSMNAMDWNRDLRLPAEAIRLAEHGMTDRRGRAGGTVTFPDMRRGEVGICVGTLIAPTARPQNPILGWNSPEQAWAQIHAQYAWYEAMQAEGEIALITSAEQLDRAERCWAAPDHDTPIGVVVSLEGADPIRQLGDLETLRARGLRALGPAHYGPGRYANGTDATGGLPACGRDLVKEMDRLGLILDATHLCDDCFWEALDLFEGPVWASHSNCRSLVPHNRQFSDDQFKALFERDAVIGSVFDVWMMIPDWVRGKSKPLEAGVFIETIGNHIDHIAQLAGTAKHCGIGSDLDGGFGREQSPGDLDTIADLQTLRGILQKRGFSDDDIEGIFHRNFVGFLERVL